MDFEFEESLFWKTLARFSIVLLLYLNAQPTDKELVGNLNTKV